MKKKCEQCGEAFESKRKDARFCGGKCRIDAVRGKPPVAKSTDFAAAFVTPDEKVELTAKCHQRATMGGNRHGKTLARKQEAGDINAMARQVILSKVPVKRVEDDSIEARLKRLEQAMKQYAKKPAPQQKKGEPS